MAIDDPLTHSIIGCAMNVHNILGNGFQEVIYLRALAIELKDAGIEFIREQEMPIYYKNHEIGSRRVDFLVGNRVMVELKALTKLEEVHRLANGCLFALQIAAFACCTILGSHLNVVISC